MPWCSRNVRIRMMIKQMEDSGKWKVVEAKHSDSSLHDKIEEIRNIFYPPRFKSEFKEYSLGNTDFYCLKLSDRVSRKDIETFLKENSSGK